MRGKVTIGLGAAALATLAALGLFATGASATQFKRPFLGTFGSAEQPSFAHAYSIAVDPTTGDVLVGSAPATGKSAPGSISRFHPDGTPAPFSALGSNTIDGKQGPGGHTRAECETAPEPASCDETPQDVLTFSTANHPSPQIAVDPVNGDILITQITELLNSVGVVDVFSSTGAYLGQLTQAAGAKLADPCGVVVDSTGAVYVAQPPKISKYVPAANPPVNADNTANFKDAGFETLCRMALGSGPSAGSIFISNTGGGNPGPRTLKVNKETGSFSEFAVGLSNLVAVDPTTGNPITLATGGGRPALETGEIGYEELAELDGSLASTSSALSRLTVEASDLTGVSDYATEASGQVIVTYSSPASPTTHVLVYGSPAVAPTVSAGAASEITSSEATLAGSVNPEGVAVSECFFEYGPVGNVGEHTAPCEESIPTDSSDHAVHARISGLQANGAKYSFVLVARNANGVSERSSTESLLTGSATETKPATVTSFSTATVHGLVHPEGRQYTECVFEWGLTSSAAYEHTAPCDPKAGEIPPDTAAHAVSASITKLQEGTSYRYRVKAANAEGAQTGSELTFETFGAPLITVTRAADATQEAATLEAEVNPHGYEASYRFEWGPTASYGHVAPASFQPIGSGTSPVRVSAQLAGLSEGSVYHYRIVASGPAGSTASPDQELETLDSCGLPDGRCFELVSPREPGPVDLPNEGRAQFEKPFQASEAPGSLAYMAELGLTGATTGGEILYGSSRAADGWEVTQLSPALTGAGPGSGVRAVILGLSPNLECGVVASKLALTADPVAQVNIEAGGGNLYRRGPGGSYTLITNAPPEAPKRIGEPNKEFELVGMSADCERVVFYTEQHYSGLPGVGSKRLYEWDEGTLRYVGWVPAGGGEAPAEAKPGSGTGLYHAVSADGSRVFFAATSQAGNDHGKQAVFVRIDGTKTLDVSQSPLAEDTGATYQGATPDGSRVYFLANAGLTKESSPEGRDLYECHIVTGAGGEPECKLTDLSVDHEPGGAEAGGETGGGATGSLVGVADDGSHVYFVAQGQLVRGRGGTLAQNRAAHDFSLYDYELPSGAVEYVAGVSEAAFNEEGSATSHNLAAVTTGNFTQYTSRVSHDGSYLLFESSLDLTGYDSGGVPVVYVYSAPTSSAAEGRLECASCRPDGKPSLNDPAKINRSLQAEAVGNDPAYQPQSLVVRDGRPVVFFKSRDDLASGAVEGERQLYEWAHGQDFEIAAELPGTTEAHLEAGTLGFFGASSEGGDLYFADSAALNWENPEARRSVWDARVGGGFPQPPPPVSCDSTAEGSCQTASGPPATPAEVASAKFTGPGNLIAPLAPASEPTAPKPKPLTRAQQLAKALRACRKDKKKAKRAACERSARSRYGPPSKAKGKSRKHAKSHKGGK